MAPLMYNFGKLLLVAALVAHGYIILIDHSFKATWEHDIKLLSKTYNHPQWENVIPLADKILIGIAGLQIASVLHLLSNRTQVVAFLNILGVLILSVVMTNPMLYSSPIQKKTVIAELLRNLAIVGGLLWYITSSLKDNRIENEKRLRGQKTN